MVGRHWRELYVFTVGGHRQGNILYLAENPGKTLEKQLGQSAKDLRVKWGGKEKRNTRAEPAKPAGSTIWRVQCHTPSSRQCGRSGKP